MELELDTGFTVLTGETGAGKSILVDALQLVTGARADVGVIREGATRAEVSAEFSTDFDSAPALQTLLDSAGFESGDTLLLRRTVDAQGKSRAWVNGSPATAQQMRQMGEQLMDIHGQHAWQSLTRSDAVRGLLDAYAKVSTAILSQLWSAWRSAQSALEQASQAQDSLQSERERLAWQIGELEKLNPQADEWAELNTSHSRLANGQALLDAAQGVLELLEEADSNALHALNTALQLLQCQSHLEPDFADPIAALTSSVAQVEDVLHSLRSYARHAELDPERLAELDARMTLWVSLARRYKHLPEELPALLSGWRAELVQLEAAADLQGLQKAERQAQAAFMAEAKALSAQRAKAAPKLAQSITRAMQGLGMQGGQFVVALEPLAQAQQSGLEDVQFLVAGHAGSTPRPVGKVASGGELSRMALAIAVTTSQLGTAQTLIFDEVDAGVGGAVAETVGRLMRQLGADRQVLAVTHLPQVAACADHHMRVSKQLQGQSTQSTVGSIQGEQRVAEIARMLAGEKLSSTSLAHAREMLQTGS
ncbi:MAG: DNA repair protein RecN [Rhodoferax sp.]|nr:DNA repair protein RecN [Rhodoferax sp.]